jgi:hypothetical protein
MTQVYTAHRQWSSRPADERFTNIDDLELAVLNRKNISHEGNIKVNEITVKPDGENIIIAPTGYDDVKLSPTHWSFNQLCNLSQAPAHYLRTLPADLVAQNLNYKLPDVREDMKILLHINDTKEIRSFNGVNYGRIWDADVVKMVKQRILSVNPHWKNPPAYKGGNFGGETEPAGLYASDRDVFLFFVDEENLIKPDGIRGEGLKRGFIIGNSEVGKCSFWLMTFLFNEVCNNHIIWGASDVKEIRIRHSKYAPDRALKEIMPKLVNYVESSARDEEATIAKAIDHRPLGNNPEDKDITGWLRNKGFTRAVAQDAVDYAKREEGDASSLWNIVQGITAYARDRKHMDARVDLESSAGKLMELVN